MAGDWLDGIARELARGQSRRDVLRRLGGALVVLVASSRLPETASAQTTCSEGQTLCGKVCVDTSSDPKNCGRCKGKCPNGTTCRDGACRCPQGRVLCGKKCVATETDPKNCGLCKRKCRKGTTCVTGVCGGCTADGDCTGNRVCRDGRCVSRTCTPPCGSGEVCLDGACIPSPCSVQQDETKTTFQFTTQTSFNGQPLVLNQTVEKPASADSLNMSQVITLAGTPVLEFTVVTLGSTTQIITKYGSMHGGVSGSSFTNDGNTITGEVDGRAIVPIPVGSTPPDTDSLQFQDGQPAPTLTVDPALAAALGNLLRKARSESGACLPAQGRPARIRTKRLGTGEGPGVSFECVACVSGCTAGLVYCGYGIAAGCAPAAAACGIGYGVCVAAAAAVCVATTYGCASACRSEVCCPLDCNNGVCCFREQRCVTSNTGATLCCSQNTGPGCGDRCCESPTDRCTPNLSCCPQSREICGNGCCGPAEACCNGTCCPGFAQCCNGTCCQSGEQCVGGVCCKGIDICGSTCCSGGRICCNGVCCPLNQACDAGICKDVCSSQQFPCPAVPGNPTCCFIGRECCPGVGCCGSFEQCCSKGTTNECIPAGAPCVR